MKLLMMHHVDSTSPLKNIHFLIIIMQLCTSNCIFNSYAIIGMEIDVNIVPGYLYIRVVRISASGDLPTLHLVSMQL